MALVFKMLNVALCCAGIANTLTVQAARRLNLNPWRWLNDDLAYPVAFPF